NSSDSKLLPDCLKIFGLALVLRCRRSGDHLEISQTCEFGQNFVLNTDREVSVRLFIAQVLEWKDGDTFFRNRETRNAGAFHFIDIGLWSRAHLSKYEQAGRDRRQHHSNADNLPASSAPDRFCWLNIFSSLQPFGRDFEHPC